MAKRVGAFHISNSGDEVVPMKRTKFSVKNLGKTDAIGQASPLNSDTSDSGNEFNSESEHERQTSRTNAKCQLNSDDSRNKARKNKAKCESKNAVTARINRIKKKNYVEGLEMKNAQLEAENKELQSNIDLKTEEISALKREVMNLKNLIRNRTEIGALLRCIHLNTDFKITSSILDSFSYAATASKASQVLRSAVPTKNEKYTMEKQPTESSVWSSSDEEGKTPSAMLSNYSRNSSILNVNSNISHAGISPRKIAEEFSVDHHPELDHDYTIEQSQVSRFEMDSPNILFPEELDDFNRCDTPSRGTNSEFVPSFADEDLGFNLGICLHVVNKQVSLEFCDACNDKASLASGF